MPDPQKGECLQKVQNKINTWMLSAMTELGSKLAADCPGQEERSSAARRLMAMTAATERHSQSRMLLAKTGAPCLSNCVENPCAYECQCLAERSFSRKSRTLLESDPICPNPRANQASTQQVAVGAGQKWSNGACCGDWVGECSTPTPRCTNQKLETSVSIAGSSKTVNMTTVRYTAAGGLDTTQVSSRISLAAEACTNGADGQACQNGGTATGTTGSCGCSCASGYSGNNCETAAACTNGANGQACQ